MNEKVRLWMDYAKDDLAFAKSGMEDGYYSHVCYLSQQCMEKVLKGFLVAQDKQYPKSHDLVRLYKLCGSPEWLGDIVNDLSFASLAYIPMRYPDALPGTLPDREPTEKDAKLLLGLAEKILTLVGKRLAAIKRPA